MQQLWSFVGLGPTTTHATNLIFYPIEATFSPKVRKALEIVLIPSVKHPFAIPLRKNTTQMDVFQLGAGLA